MRSRAYLRMLIGKGYVEKVRGVPRKNQCVVAAGEVHPHIIETVGSYARRAERNQMIRRTLACII